MPMNKPHREFHRLDMKSGWETMRGYPLTISRRSCPATSMSAARWAAVRACCALSRVPSPPRHSCMITGKRSTCLKGISWWAVTREGRGGEPFSAPTYACRPPGAFHGPFRSERGCVLFEIHYYDESGKKS